ncbi:hypothetical protein X271_00254 [Candidatus Hepatoplasma crinochetorum Av]|jgi:methyl-accepting chemotaxis protein|uniref:Uncharacterized protein n=1 Tax=Candidatus Hepatoplasma crinochetorum Av TaxID=1427984 RepID=W8GSE8_9MOLU|nr:hypothetical protein [Candidatus Hepatoplasma crinochetorum]AHK22360.1 hypothetical protein X271_00254 [Candidatus Hepatoplasma crinochetorum Av]
MKKNKNNFLNNIKWLISKWWFWTIIVIWFIIFFLSLTKFIPSTNNDWIVWIEFFFSSIIALLSFSIAIIIAKDSKTDLEYNTEQTENINKILNSVNQIIKKTKELAENTNEKVNILSENRLNVDSKEKIDNKILNSVNQIIKKIKPEIEKTKIFYKNTNEIDNILFKNPLNVDSKEKIDNKLEKEINEILKF